MMGYEPGEERREDTGRWGLRMTGHDHRYYASRFLILVACIALVSARMIGKTCGFPLL
jgi:hypothetical protein